MQGGEQPAFADEEIPGNLAGVYMGFLEPTSKAVVNILGQFFKRPEVLQQARAAAKEEDTDRMLGLAMEAMRFHPNAPVLLRYNAKDQTIGGKDGRKRRKIPGGKKLYVMTKSAMFDKRSVEDPKRFKGDRPRETYLYFGFGMHTCFGNYVNMVSIPEMLIALLKREDLSPKGKVVNDGPFPDKWMWA